jgi:hypothetical protein
MHNEIIATPQRLTMPNVKVRRLGYLCGFTKILGNSSMPEGAILSRMREWAVGNQGFLEKHCEALPAVRRKWTKTPGSINDDEGVERYIKVAQELGLLVKIARQWQNSKIGNILRVLPAEENPFDLTLPQAFVLLKLILKKDYDYLKTIFDMSRTFEWKTEEDEWRIFQNRVKERFLDKTRSTHNSKSVVDLQDSMRQLLSWTKNPKKFYEENIKATRLEWLMDLGLLESWNQKYEKYTFRRDGFVLFEPIFLSEQWLNDTYPSQFYSSFNSLFARIPERWEAISATRKEELLRSFLDNSLTLFEPLNTLPKISATQFFEYCTTMLLCKHLIICDYQSLDRDLTKYITSRKSKYRFVKMISGDDIGYIVRE